jgi:hypothetical protein
MTILIFFLFNGVAGGLLYFSSKFYFSRFAGKSETYLRWEAMPILLFVVNFVFLAAINWTYESKFFRPVYSHNQLDYHTPVILFLISIALLIPVCGLLFALRWLEVKFKNTKSLGFWMAATLLYLMAIGLLIASFSTLWLGPAALEMIEQSHS